MQGPTWDPLPATFSQKKKNRTNKRKKIAAPVREAASCARKRGSARVRNWFCAALVRCRRWLFPPFFPIRRRRLLIPFQAVAEGGSRLLPFEDVAAASASLSSPSLLPPAISTSSSRGRAATPKVQSVPHRSCWRCCRRHRTVCLHPVSPNVKNALF
jgi:hypothetical protein